MANQQFRKVKLVDSQDKAYLDFCSERALAGRTLRDKLPPTAINQLSLLFEDIMRNLLREHFTLSANIILSFEERCNGFSYIQKYREIDAVGLDRSRPNLLLEIKTSSKPDPEKTIWKARKQLRKSKKVASWLNPDLKLCVIYIDIYSQKTIIPSALSSFDIDLGKSLDILKSDVLEEIPCIVLSGAEIWHRGLSRGLIENSSLWAEAQAEIEENIYKRELAEASKAKGIPAEKSPKKTTAKIFQFGDFNGETSFGQAFLKAQQKQKNQHSFA